MFQIHELTIIPTGQKYWLWSQKCSHLSYLHSNEVRNLKFCNKHNTGYDMFLITYVVCSKSILIGIVVVVHWVGRVCNQSWHVRTCLSNSWHKLQVAVVGRGSNTCVYVITIFTMYESTEQRICIKYCFKIGKTATETYQLLQQAYGEDAMGCTQVFDWFHRFKEGRTSAESNPRSGRLSPLKSEEMIAKVRTIIRSNRRLTVRQIADECGISVGSGDTENNWKNGGMVTGSCTTTICPHTLHILCSSFWPNTAPLSFSSRHTHHISHRVTFSYPKA